jgi:sulfoxide reductase heme-binding subunit YedZ
MYPWIDYGGRISPFKLVVFVALFVPAAWVALAYGQGWLGARPLTEAIHQIGLWTIRLLFIALAVTPLRQLLRWPRLVIVRRMIGVAAFCYAAVHLSLYVADQGFDLGKAASEIVLRYYLTIGFVTVLGLAILAATSTDGMVRRLGGRRWQKLHRIVYGLGILALIHYFLQSKLDEFEPLFIAGFFAWLMGYRIVAALRRDRRPPLWATAALGVAAAALTACGEAAYYWSMTGVGPLRVLEANFSLETGLRPAWIVLAAAAAVVVLAALRGVMARETRVRLRTA